MKIVNYKIGMLVDHPNRPQWGPGKIVHIDATKVHVFFRDALERRARPIVVSAIQLLLAGSQSDPDLDRLPAASLHDGSWLLPASYGIRVDGAAPSSKPKRKSKLKKFATR